MTLNLYLLEKVWALGTSPVAGEAQAAMHRAKLMVEAVGKTLDDVPELLSGLLGVRGQFTHQRPNWYSAEHEVRMGWWAERKRRWNDGVLKYGQPDVLSGTETGRLVRAWLKVAFPGVKFRVRTTGVFLVEWIGKPAEADVEAFVARFAPGRVWLRQRTIVRAPLGGMEDMERVWADPPPKPHPYAKLVWFDHHGIFCFQYEGAFPEKEVGTSRRPSPPGRASAAGQPPPSPPG